jgi:anti-sigma regulatory factor (Ser/Thr protein kinase)
MLEPGDAFILYTDGLVEARKNILDGMDALQRTAAEVAHLPAERLASELVTRALAGAERRDDTLALVLRRDFVGAVVEQCSWSITPDAVFASTLRQALEVWLQDRGIDRDDVLTTAAELLANAVRAAQARVVLHAKLTANSIVLEVSDDGVAVSDLATRGLTLPDAEAERGRGLYMVRALGASVDVLTTGEGTTIRATLRRTPPTTGQEPGDLGHIEVPAPANFADGELAATQDPAAVQQN